MRRLLIVMLVMLLITGVAAGEGMAPMELYDEGMESYYMENYEAAAEYFGKAGNYQDARKWAYYCEAILLVMNGKCTQEEIFDAEARFTLLANQSFRDADQWLNYTKGREWQDFVNNKEEAKSCYITTMVLDSLERYMECCGKADLLKTRPESLSDLEKYEGETAVLSVEEYYDKGMEAYYFEEYALAADYFTAAGNYMDARQWRCFTLAISLVTQYDNLSDAEDLFESLTALGFRNADEWCIYIDGRNYEAGSSWQKACGCYESIMVYDSCERFLQLFPLLQHKTSEGR